jgi:hypothetical protein
MAKLTLNDISNLYGNTTAAETAINTNSARIETALENTLSRDGTAPNQMNASLDMNSNRIINVAPGINPSDAVTVEQLQSVDTPSLELDDLTDVQYSGNAPVVGDRLVWTGTYWTNASSGASGTVEVLDDLTDVVITAPVNQQALVFNGTQWINTTLPSGVTDHGALTGLSDDDHQQYMNTTRGDARYALNSVTISTTGSLTGGGSLAQSRTISLINDQASPPSTHYYGTNAAGTKGYFPIPQNSPDHGTLQGLGDDDHPQYLNTTRGNALYATISHTHSQYANKTTADTISASWQFSQVPYVSSAGSFLYHSDPNMTSGKITVSSNPPSGGNNGDIWFVVV